MSQSRRDIGMAPRKDRNKPTRIKPEVARWGVKWARASNLSFSHDDMYGMDEGEADALSELELLGEDESDETDEADLLEEQKQVEAKREQEEAEARRLEEEKKQRKLEEAEAKRLEEKKQRELEEAEAKRLEEEKKKQRELEEAEARQRELEAEWKRQEEERQQAELALARQNFQAAWNQLGYDACLLIANKAEEESLKDRKAKIDLTCMPPTKDAYESATKLLPSLIQLIAKIEKEDQTREKYQTDSQQTLNLYDEQLKASIANLKTFKSTKVDRLDKDRRESSKAANDELKKHRKEVNKSVIDDNLRKMNVAIVNTNSDVDDLRSKEQDRLEKKNAAKDRDEYAKFNFADPETWVMDPVVTDKIPQNIITDNSGVVANIRTAGIGPKNGSPCTGQGYHCHTTSGSGGFSFCYNHLGGCRVQPVIYDYCVNRNGNAYDWVLKGSRNQGGHAPIPGYVQANRKPEPEPEKKPVKTPNTNRKANKK